MVPTGTRLSANTTLEMHQPRPLMANTRSAENAAKRKK